MFRLLICDDHPPIRTVLRLLAKEANGNCDVTETGSAQELLAELEGRRQFDLLTLDLHLPGQSGLSILASVKQIRPQLPVMVLSADESPESVTAALNGGASSYLFKSVSERRLFQALRDASDKLLSLPAGYTGVAGQELHSPPPPRRSGAESALELSPRQREVLDCLLKGMSAKQIARALAISEGTVKSHTVAVFRSLNVGSRSQAIVEAHRRGISLGA